MCDKNKRQSHIESKNSTRVSKSNQKRKKNIYQTGKKQLKVKNKTNERKSVVVVGCVFFFKTISEKNITFCVGSRFGYRQTNHQML